MVDIFSLATLAVVRLQAIYRPFLLLHMKKTRLGDLHDGKHLSLEIMNVGYLRLFQLEVEARSQAKFKRYLRAGTVPK